MALDAKLIRRLQKELESTPGTSPGGDASLRGPRLIDDARRLVRRAMRFVERGVISADAVDLDALELACWAMQLPLCQRETFAVSRMGLVSLRDRAEQAAELLVSLIGGEVDESLLDRTTRLLHETPQRPPVLDEAKLLADIVSLEDYGVTGLLQTLVRLSLSGQGLAQLQESIVKREQYGYFEARLKDGFNFEPARQIAKRRLDNARAAAKLILAELEE